MEFGVSENELLGYNRSGEYKHIYLICEMSMITSICWVNVRNGKEGQEEKEKEEELSRTAGSWICRPKPRRGFSVQAMQRHPRGLRGRDRGKRRGVRRKRLKTDSGTSAHRGRQTKTAQNRKRADPRAAKI